jgi:hypothetical protein
MNVSAAGKPSESKAMGRYLEVENAPAAVQATDGE